MPLGVQSGDSFPIADHPGVTSLLDPAAFIIVYPTTVDMPMSFSRTTRMINTLLASWKWLLSFRKPEWSVEDYPIRVTRQEPDAIFSAPRFVQHLYRAYIINGAITGSGNTITEAIVDLRQNFESIRQRRKEEALPAIRPGAKWPIEFASQEKISADESLSEDFIRKVLGLDWAWISDESSLWDFHTEQTNDRLVAKIREVYGVDVSDIESARLWEILERIKRVKAVEHDHS